MHSAEPFRWNYKLAKKHCCWFFLEKNTVSAKKTTWIRRGPRRLFCHEHHMTPITQTDVHLGKRGRSRRRSMLHASFCKHTVSFLMMVHGHGRRNRATTKKKKKKKQRMLRLRVVQHFTRFKSKPEGEGKHDMVTLGCAHFARSRWKVTVTSFFVIW
jgi:hypothetical protein